MCFSAHYQILISHHLAAKEIESWHRWIFECIVKQVAQLFEPQIIDLPSPPSLSVLCADDDNRMQCLISYVTKLCWVELWLCVSDENEFFSLLFFLVREETFDWRLHNCSMQDQFHCINWQKSRRSISIDTIISIRTGSIVLFST